MSEQAGQEVCLQASCCLTFNSAQGRRRTRNAASHSAPGEDVRMTMLPHIDRGEDARHNNAPDAGRNNPSGNAPQLRVVHCRQLAAPVVLKAACGKAGTGHAPDRSSSLRTQSTMMLAQRMARRRSRCCQAVGRAGDMSAGRQGAGLLVSMLDCGPHLLPGRCSHRPLLAAPAACRSRVAARAWRVRTGAPASRMCHRR